MLVECTIPDEPAMLGEAKPSTPVQGPMQDPTNTWEANVNRSSNFEGSEAGLIIVSLEGVIAKHIMCFEFLEMNNRAEYEALIIELIVAKELGVLDLKNYGDS